jgi:hypothetical protein
MVIMGLGARVGHNVLCMFHCFNIFHIIEVVAAVLDGSTSPVEAAWPVKCSFVAAAGDVSPPDGP